MAKVIVGMSGGVDSAVAAYLLKKQGYEVIGLTLRTWLASDGTESRCCEIDDARRAAWSVDIPYYTLNSSSVFQSKVINPFIDDYICGLTPNPCIECNRFVKWERMLYFAKVTGADFVATGHYASVVQLANGRYTVKKALHAEKDQTYMLAALSQEQLSATLMPLGGLSKDVVRSIAREAGIPVAEKEDSQEICFVTDGNYSDFITQNAGRDLSDEGHFVDEDGKILGKSRGIFHYTVGQRKGLCLAMGYPVYVKKILADKNLVVVAKDESLCSSEIICRKTNFMSIPGIAENESICCTVKIRYHHQGEKARIENFGRDVIRVVFEKPVRAAAPGQSAVFYDDDNCVIGCAVIAEVR